MKLSTPTIRAYLIPAIGCAAVLYLGWQLILGRHSFNSPAAIPAMLVLLACTAALLWRFPSPIQPEASQRKPRTGWFVLVILAAILILFPLRTLVGPPLLLGLPVLAGLVLLLARQPLAKKEVVYALALALVAGLAGLGAGWITSFSMPGWALLQVFLTLPGLLAGWAILRRTGLRQEGIGRSRYLEEDASSALRGFLLGMLAAAPWALGNLVMGSANGESWVKAWWQPLTAIQPGIAEEAWGRVLLVPLLFLVFKPFAPARTAFTASLLVNAIWFAYLHTQGGIEGILSALLIGILFALPVSYLCLYRDLETAIGFHFCMDLVKFAFALLFLN